MVDIFRSDIVDVREITKIVRNMTLYKNSVNKRTRELNETEYEMLRYITKRDSRSFKEVASYLNIDKALVTRMSKKLSALEYIKIEADPNDSRSKRLIACDKAFRLKDNIVGEEEFFYDKCLRALTDEEKAKLLELIEKVYLESKKFRKNGWNFYEE